MARLKYLGRKEGYGPLSLKWMVEEIKFKDGISEEVEPEIAEAVCLAARGMFEIVKAKVSGKKSPGKKEKKD